MSSENFEDILYDLDEAIAALKSSINSANNQSRDQRRATLRSAENEVDKADDYINLLIVEARNAPPRERGGMNDKIREYKSTLSSLKRQLTSADERSNLLGDNPSPQNQSMGVRDQMHSNQKTLNKTSSRIANTKRMAYEAQGIGEGVMEDLHGQRETIVRIGGKVQNIDANMSRANKILNSMTRRIMSHKMIMIATIFLLICILVVVLLKKLHVI
eukprot:m.22087 g.22087  ORF g.22087 m.22087 type:complete len:216 (-) comp5421_c0_seq1:1036-1683(-)